jgi:hypothetical protein
MDPLATFERALEGLKPETRKKYLRAARNAIEAIGEGSGTNESVSELAEKLQHQSLLLEPSKRGRISPFLRFLRDLQPPTAAPNRSMEITESIIATLVRCLEKTPSQSIAAKRDWALIAAFCFAPTRGTPRKWPVECLKTREDKVFLWSASVEVPSFKRALYLWLDWRMRSARPEQQHLFRVSEGWGRSRLLFPNPQGKALSRGALRNALARLQKTSNKALCNYTANQIRDAFIIYWTENGRFH